MLKDIFSKIPGFRTGKKWKMIAAVLVYLLFIIIVTNPSGVAIMDKIIVILNYLILFGIPFVLITNLGNIRSKLPLFRKRTIKTTILGSVVTFFIIIIVVSMVDQLKSPEQKQLDQIAAQPSEQLAQTKMEAKIVGTEFNDRIMSLGDIDSITYDKADNVNSIRKEYEALTSEEKSFVTKLDFLESAEKKIEGLMKDRSATLDFKITSLGNIDSLTSDKADVVISIRKEYEALTSEQKSLVTQLDLLVSAEKKIKEIMTEAAMSLDNRITSLENVESLTYDKADVVISIRKEYEALNSDQKILITNLVTLESAERKISDLKIKADKAASEKAAEEKAAAAKKAAEQKAAADKKAAEEKAAEDYQNWIDGQFSAWDGSHIELVKLVKEHLNDPKSYDHVETVYWDKGTYIIVKMTYRAKNGFGALILQNVTANADYATNYISIVSQND